MLSTSKESFIYAAIANDSESTMPIHQNIQTLFDAVAKELSLEIGHEISEKLLTDRISAAWRRYRDEPIALHGRRIEAMFQFVASSLGGCRVIVQEDAGSIVTSEENLSPPDYRIVLKDGSQFFVEVKNCHTDPFTEKRFSLKRNYAESLTRYAAQFGQEVKIAVYWSRTGMWTLVSLSRFTESGEKLSLTLFEAAKRNEMALLGDMEIATTAPLVMRMDTDSSKPRDIEPDGNTEFTVGKVTLYSGGIIVTNKFEMNLCIYFMMFGKWSSSGPKPIIESNILEAIEFVCEPEESVPGQGFDFLGALSTMVARYYDYLTAPDKSVERLAPNRDPSTLGILIPDDYKGEQLKLWRFVLQPSYE